MKNTKEIVVPLLTSPERKIRFAEYPKYFEDNIYGKDFPKALSFCYHESKKRDGMTEGILADMTHLQSSSISSYMSDERTPSLYNLVAVCIALRLHYSVSQYLLKKCRYSLDPDNEIDSICIGYLQGCGFDLNMTVDTCNKELNDSDFPPLHDLKLNKGEKDRKNEN